MMNHSQKLVSRFARRAVLGLGLAIAGAGALGCEDSGKKSADGAKSHVEFLATAATKDVSEVRAGLPHGAEQLVSLFADAQPEKPDAQSARKALTKARDKVQDLRVAKSTFFAVTTVNGEILRNDLEQDDMAGKNAFAAYPDLKRALKKYVETRGTMTEASGVRGREDAQWVAASPIASDGETVGLYVTGWSWSAYAYRLETSIRSHVISETTDGGKVPLLYVYVVVDKEIYGAPVAPMISAKAIMKLDPLAKAKGDAVWATPLDIDGRRFGVAVKRVSALGDNVALAVLRSET